jgi:nitroreductase
MGAVFEAIKNRRSIRKYKADEVPKDKLLRVLEAANWAPSNGNMQSWSFVVTKGEAVDKVCKVFSDFAQEYIPKAPYIPEDQKAGMLKYAENFGGAPVHITVVYDVFEGDDEKTEKSMQAACAAVQNLMLAAWEEGLGTVWISGHVCESQITRDVLGLNETQAIAAIVPIGYPDESPSVPREDVQSKTKWIGF